LTANEFTTVVCQVSLDLDLDLDLDDLKRLIGVGDRVKLLLPLYG
jgi:hypothetical protein